MFIWYSVHNTIPSWKTTCRRVSQSDNHFSRPANHPVYSQLVSVSHSVSINQSALVSRQCQSPEHSLIQSIVSWSACIRHCQSISINQSVSGNQSVSVSVSQSVSICRCQSVYVSISVSAIRSVIVNQLFSMDQCESICQLVPVSVS